MYPRWWSQAFWTINTYWNQWGQKVTQWLAKKNNCLWCQLWSSCPFELIFQLLLGQFSICLASSHAFFRWRNLQDSALIGAMHPTVFPEKCRWKWLKWSIFKWWDFFQRVNLAIHNYHANSSHAQKNGQPRNLRNFRLFFSIYHLFSGWCLCDVSFIEQATKLDSKNWIISQIGVTIKNIWNHHLELEIYWGCVVFPWVYTV